MICYNYMEWCLDIRLWSRKKMKDVAHIEKKYSSITKSLSYFSAIILRSQDSTKRYLTVMCKKSYKGDQKVKKNFFRYKMEKIKTWRPSKSFEVIPKKFWWSYDKNCGLLIFSPMPVISQNDSRPFQKKDYHFSLFDQP